MKITEQSRFAVVFSVIVASLLSALALSACQRQPDESEATATTVSADIATLPATPTAAEPTVVIDEPTATTAAPTATPEPTVEAPTVAPEETITTGADLLAVAGGLDRFSTLLATIDTTTLAETLRAEGPFTFFAPMNDAFEALPEEARDALLADADALSSLLQNHVVQGRVDLQTALAQGTLQTMSGNTLTVTAGENGAVLVDGFEVRRPDVAAGNGFLHAIDAFLFPPGNIRPPIIDETGVPVFNSRILTVVGTGEPGTTLVITLNGETFGTTTVEADGTWLVDRRLPDGEHTIIAYTLDENNIPIARSKPVILISPAP